VSQKELVVVGKERVLKTGEERTREVRSGNEVTA